jgi:hypothetical protein
MSEALHTCPKCQRGKFTTAGLRSHRCKPVLSLPPSAEISVEVVKAEKTALVQIRHVTNLAPLDQIISSIRADHALFESHSKTAAFLALRIGLRLVWVKDNGGHGSLDPFIKEHLPSISRASLTRYIRIADAFVTEQKGWRDKKTFKLLDDSKIKPILDQQLELFTDPNATLDIHCKQLVKWVDNRGLTQIYRDLGREDDTGPPQGHQGDIKKKKKTAEQLNREAFTAALVDFKAPFAGKKWHALFEKDRIDFEKWITKAAITVREYNATCAKDAKKAKAKGAAAK